MDDADGSLLDSEVQEDFDDEEEESMNHDRTTQNAEGSAGEMGTILNMTNNIVGAGLLSLPGCLRDASLVPGMLLLCLIASLSAITFILIAYLCEKSKAFTYRALGSATIGPRFGVFMQVVIMTYTGISCLSYLILCADFVSGDTGLANWWCTGTGCNWFVEYSRHRWFPILFFALCFLAPLSVQRNLSALKYTSFLSFLGMTYTMLLTVWYYSSVPAGPATPEQEPANSTVQFFERGQVEYFRWTLGLFEAVPVMNVAFIAHYNAPRYYEELRDRSLPRFARCVGVALGGCFLVYGLTALFGYLAFGSATASDILQNYGGSYPPAVLGRFAMTLVVLFTYPLAFHSLRSSYSALFLSARGGGRGRGGDAGFYRVSACLGAATVAPSLLLSDIGVVLKYKGALFGGLIAYGFPAAMFLKFTGNGKYSLVAANQTEDLLDSSALRQARRDCGVEPLTMVRLRGFAWFLCVFCLVTGVLSTIVTTTQVLHLG